MLEPFLTRYASERVPFADIEGYYSPRLSMWVTEVGGVEMPFIEQHGSLVELVTKTMAQPESDDQLNTPNTIAEIQKSPRVTMYAGRDAAICLELATKTEAQLERDDPDTTCAGGFI